jgi:hypothetical protein
MMELESCSEVDVVVGFFLFAPEQSILIFALRFLTIAIKRERVVAVGVWGFWGSRESGTVPAW